MKSIICLSLFLIGIQVHCYHIQRHHDLAKNHTFNCHKLAGFNGDFALRLYNHLASDSASKNIFISPLSISIAFSMLALGAKSETQSQIYKGLAFDLSVMEEEEIHESFQQLIRTVSDPNITAQVKIGNSFFVQKSLNLLPEFLEDADILYNAEGFTTNFTNATMAEKQINDYVANKTSGKVTHMIEGLDSRTVMVLLNYIFFEAAWKNPFSTNLIREEDFFVDENTVVKVNMMNRNGHYKYVYDKDLSCWVVKVPYKGDDAVAWFILPNDGKMRDVEAALSKSTIIKWKRSFQDDQEINLYIPKLAISGSYDVQDLLQRMGITDVFSDNADLSEITGEPNLKVSRAIHKAMLDINERGTEAAAVTVTALSPRGGSHPITLKLNKPFMIFILHKSTCGILFMGKIMNPAEN